MPGPLMISLVAAFHALTCSHSLGGALAMLAAARQAQSSFGSVGAVYTFGAPRVGDNTWKQAYDGLGLGSYTYRCGARIHMGRREMLGPRCFQRWRRNSATLAAQSASLPTALPLPSLHPLPGT